MFKQSCQRSLLPGSGCGILSNRACVCQTSNFASDVGSCEAATCNPTDREGESFEDISPIHPIRKLTHSTLPSAVAALGYVLCNPVGGFGSINNGTSSPGFTNTTGNAGATGIGNPPVPSSFTGAASRMFESQIGWMATAMMGALGTAVFS